MAGFKNRQKYKINEREGIEATDIKLTKLAKREMLLTVISIFGVVCVSLGSAFAVFTSFSKSSEYNQVTVGTLKFKNDATNDAGGTYGDTINLSDVFPIPDQEGLASKPYQFTLTNEGTLAASYTVSIKDDTDMVTEDGCSDVQLDKSKVKISINGATPVLLSTLLDEASSSYIIDSGSMESGVNKTYQIRMWIDDAAGNEVLGKHFHGKIVIEGTEYKSTPSATLLQLVSASLTNKAGVLETLNSEQLQNVVALTPSATEIPATYGVTNFVYDVLLNENYVEGNIFFTVPGLTATDTVSVYLTDGINQVPMESTLLENGQVSLKITGSGTIVVVKNS